MGDALARDRAARRHALDRPIVSPRRMAADSCRSGDRARACVPRLPVPVMRRTPALIVGGGPAGAVAALLLARAGAPHRSEEHTSELQSLMRISYAVFCLK